MEKFDRNEWLPIMSDMSKDATGTRLRWDYESMSDEKLQQTVNYFMDLIEESNKRDAEEAAFAKFAYVNHINDMMKTHNIDRNTAIRWDKQAMGVDSDNDEYLWKWNLPFRTNIQELLRVGA